MVPGMREEIAAQGVYASRDCVQGFRILRHRSPLAVRYNAFCFGKPQRKQDDQRDACINAGETCLDQRHDNLITSIRRNAAQPGSAGLFFAVRRDDKR